MKKNLQSLLIIIILMFTLAGCGAKKIEVKQTLQIIDGQSLELIGVDLTMNILSSSEVEELKPESPQGYYDYYKDYDDYHYYVVTGIFKNENNIIVKSDDFYVRALRDGKEIEAKLILENGARSDFLYDETVADEIKFHILVIVKDGKENPNQFELYYNDKLQTDEDLENWDYCVKYEN